MPFFGGSCLAASEKRVPRSAERETSRQIQRICAIREPRPRAGGHAPGRAAACEAKKDPSGDYLSTRILFVCPKTSPASRIRFGLFFAGGPSRIRTLDQPVMSRGL